jgi:tripartite ATP-independent transporter DctM subunit
MAGIAPGLLCALAFSTTIVIIAKMRPSSITLRDVVTATWGQRFASFRLWWPVALVGFIIFGGMYGGVFSPSEAAAVAAFILILVYLFTFTMEQRRNSNAEKGVSYNLIWRDFRSRLKETAVTSAMIFLIFGGSTVFSKFIVLAGITSKFTDFVLGQELSTGVLVLLFILCYLILGCFMDAISNLSITVPIFNPIVSAAGIDPIWYATVVILAAEVGLITPPVGLNLYATKGAAEADVSLEDIIRAIFPFFFAMLACLVILYLFPPLSTFLPNLIL